MTYRFDRREKSINSKIYFIYTMSSISGVLYIGFTNDLKRRVWEHKHNLVEGFTKKYKCHKLVYYESGEDYDGSLFREKQIKKWRKRRN